MRRAAVKASCTTGGFHACGSAAVLGTPTNQDNGCTDGLTDRQAGRPTYKQIDTDRQAQSLTDAVDTHKQTFSPPGLLFCTDS